MTTKTIYTGDDKAKKIWEAIKWANQNPDGSVTISADRVKGIDGAVAKGI